MDDASQGDQNLLVEKAHHYLSEDLQGEIMTIAQQLKQEGWKDLQREMAPPSIEANIGADEKIAELVELP